MAFHVFEREQVLDLPQAEVFRFFSDAGNLRLITPKSLAFRFEEAPPETLEVGSVIRYRIRVAGISLRWVTRIQDWDPPHRFADLQARGPYAYWLHTHTFSAVDDHRTLMRDRVIYRVPFGPVGEIVRRVFVEPQLRRTFDFRERAFVPAIAGAPIEQDPTIPHHVAQLVPLAGVALVGALGAVGLWRRVRGALAR